MSDTVIPSESFIYTGNVPEELRQTAIKAYNKYKSDRAATIERIKDNELYYRSFYDKRVHNLKENMSCDTPLLFSCLENTSADVSNAYPIPNVIERDPDGAEAADALSKLLPAQFEMSRFRQAYADNVQNKLKYGTAIYGVFYNDQTKNVDIRAIDLLDVYVDAHLENIQDSRFVFISAAVDNEVLRDQYPKHKALFEGDAQIDALTQSYMLESRTEILDCYYKKPSGALHMMKLCKGAIIAATEDMEGYENGLYDHGQFPIVFDTLYPIKDSPYGFGMLDIGKSVQIHIDRLDRAITDNILINAKPRYLVKRNGGIDETEFRDISRNIVHYEGETDAIKPIDKSTMNEYYISHRENKKNELKELLANRDFQQGGVNSGVTAASAIEVLRDAGEKRARRIVSDTHNTYKEIVYMAIEIIRQFYDEPRTFRIDNDENKRDFIQFDRSMLYTGGIDELGFPKEPKPIQFDVEVVPQTENPYSRESQNNTIMSLWNAGFFLPQNMELSKIALKNMDFKRKTQLLNDMMDMLSQEGSSPGETPAAEAAPGGLPEGMSAAMGAMPGMGGAGQATADDELVAVDLNSI